MVVLPLATPVTKPAAFIVAIPGDPELHVPPETASCKTVVPPMHIVAVPVIVGTVLTVTIVIATHPAAPDAEYVIVAVPAVPAVTIPFAYPTVAIIVLLLFQAPAPSVSDAIVPGHNTPVFPAIAAGCALTVTVCVVMQ